MRVVQRALGWVMFWTAVAKVPPHCAKHATTWPQLCRLQAAPTQLTLTHAARWPVHRYSKRHLHFGCATTTAAAAACRRTSSGVQFAAACHACVDAGGGPKPASRGALASAWPAQCRAGVGCTPFKAPDGRFATANRLLQPHPQPGPQHIIEGREQAAQPPADCIYRGGRCRWVRHYALQA